MRADPAVGLLFLFGAAAAALPVPSAGQIASRSPRPELVLQTGHSFGGLIQAVAYSPDGRLLASGGKDDSIGLWDLATGTLLVRLAPPGEVTALAFSPDGRHLAAAGTSVKIWEISSTREVADLAQYSNAVAWNPDGTLLALWRRDGGAGGPIVLYDFASRKEVRAWRANEGITVMQFSRDGKALAAGGSRGTMFLWHLAGDRNPVRIDAHESGVSGIVFSPDGRMLASASLDTFLRLWDAESGRHLRRIQAQKPFVYGVALGNDWIAAAGITVQFWDPATGKPLRVASAADGARSLGGGYSLSVSPDGNQVVSGGVRGGIAFIDPHTGREVRYLGSRTMGVQGLTITPDVRLLAFGAPDGKARVWDLNAGGELYSVDAAGNAKNHLGVDLVQLDESGSRLVSRVALRGRGFDFWEASSGLHLGTHAAAGEWHKASPDGRWLAYVEEPDTVTVVQAATGQERRIATGHKKTAGGLAFSPDSRLLASSGSNDGVLKVWNVATGELLHALQHGHSVTQRPTFSPDGTTLALAYSGKIRQWSMKSGRELRPIVDERLGILTSRITYSPDGRRIVGVTRSRLIAWDAQSGAAVMESSKPPGAMASVQYTGNGCCLVSAGQDGAIRVWDARSGQELATVLSVRTDAELDSRDAMSRVPTAANDWLVVTPDGLFDGTPSAFGRMLWRFGADLTDIAPVEIFFSEFYRPGLLAEITSGKRPQAPRDIAQLDRRQPQVRLEAAETHGDARIALVNLDVAQAPPDARRPNGSGARDVRLFRNGSLVKHWRGDVLAGKDRVRLQAQVPLVAGENSLTAYAFNADNVKSLDARLFVRGAETLRRKGTAYVVAIGVNQHATPSFDLRYAVTDATAFAAELDSAQAALGNFARVERTSLIDAQATKAGILGALRNLASKVQPEDAVFVFFAGHGFADEPRFYLVPHDIRIQGSVTSLDAAALKNLFASSISDLELEASFAAIDAAQLVLIIDACHSGQALESEEKRRGPMNSKGLAQLAYEKGMYVLTAAQGHQAALEFEKLGHGLLTYVLVQEGMKSPAADRLPKDGSVVTREWLDYAAFRVPRMQLDLMHENAQRGRNLAVVAGEEKLPDVGARTLQRPRVFYRREPEATPLVIVRP